MDFYNDSETKYEEQQYEWVISNFFSHIQAVQEVTHESSSFFIGVNMPILRLSRPIGSDIWSLYIICEDVDDGIKTKEYIILGFKKVDSSLEEFYSRRNDTYISNENFINCWTNSELLERKHELTSSDALTVTLTVKRGISCYPQPTFNELPPSKLRKLDTLSEDFKNLFADNGSCDVTLQVQNKIFNAHMTILIARSSVFSAMFEHDMKEKKTGIINIPDCDPESFYKFLEYIYCGKLEDISFPSVFNLYTISDKYDVGELKSFCVQYMEQRLTEDYICDVIILAEIHREEKLLSLARELFYKNSTAVINTPKWKKMMKNHPDFVNRLIVEMTSKINV